MNHLSPSSADTFPRTTRRTAFTLIELLVVMAIIAILAALVLSSAGYIQKKGATSRASTEIAALSAALESYKSDMGDYPRVQNSGLGSNTLFAALSPSSGKMYFEFPKSMTNSSGIVDPFGSLYGYTYPGSTNRSGSNFFDLWTYAGAPTNESNAIRWIKNW